MNDTPICPRCESEKTSVLTRSPVEGVWEVYHCEDCFFAWRSTEPGFITDPIKYDREFKLNRAELDQAAMMPAASKTAFVSTEVRPRQKVSRRDSGDDAGDE